MTEHAFGVLLDAPGAAASRIQIARLGPVSDPRYGDFEITKENVANWQRNLSHLPGQRSLIDFEHRSERKPRDSEAAGWITGNVGLDGNKVMADAEWTDKGEDAIRNKRYLFLSPAYGMFRDEHGAEHDDTLCSTALTNKPVLGLPMLTLASEQRLSQWIEEDPAARFYTRALAGELGDDTRALVMLDVSQADRNHAMMAGNSLPDGSYPIADAKQLHAAAMLAASGHGDVAAAKKLIRRRAGELGVDMKTLPGFAATAPKNSADSRAPMDKALLTALGLDADAELVTALESVVLDEDASKKLLDAATGLKAKAETPAQPANPVEPIKTLEQQATETGMVLLDAERYSKLERDATAGAAAAGQLKEQRFAHAFDAALNDPKGAKVTPAERDSLHHFFTLDADATVKLIEDREPVVRSTPRGAAAINLDADTADDPAAVAQAGLHPASHELDRAIKAKLKELGKPIGDYAVVLDQYMTGAIEL